MRVGVDIRSLTEQRGRGVSHYAASLLESMIKSHPEDEWVLLQTGRHRYELPPQLAQPNVRLRHVRVPNRLFNPVIGLARLPRTDRLAGRPDVFFAPNFGFLSLAGTPLVLTIHDLSFQSKPEYYTTKDRLWHRAVRTRSLAHQAKKIITVSQQTKQEVIDHYQVAPDKITVIHSGVDEQYLQPVSDGEIMAIREKYGLPKSYCLFVGALEPRKNIDSMVQAYRLARQTGLTSELVLAGAPTSHVSQALSEPDASIHALGYIPEADKRSLYAGALVNLLVSYHEGFGFTPLEALAMGTPSIVSDLPIFAETVAEAAVTVDPSDVPGIAQNLVHLEQDPGRRNALLRRRDAILADFSWEAAAGATYDVLSSAAV